MTTVTRPYPPAYVDERTLAYLLDCSPRTVRDYASAGLLPKAQSIGNLKRWKWTDVEHFLDGSRPDQPSQELSDEYSASVARFHGQKARPNQTA